MDKILTGLLGTATTTGAGTPATSGTTGTPSKPAAAITIDEATRTQLMEVRTHLTAYAIAMSGANIKAPEPAPAVDPSVTQPPATPPIVTTPPPMTTLPATTPRPAQPPVTGQPPVTTPPVTTQAPTTPPTIPAETSAAPVDQEAARRHLIETRDTLSTLTQLPAAAQLSGDARTQVTQLIANFNELITTESDWPASYAKVTANMTALLGPDNTDAEATGGVPTTAGTTGAVGTSGTITVSLDPAVRAKLVEMRKQLNAFEKASGVIKKAGE